jgi:hypothetical protein
MSSNILNQILEIGSYIIINPIALMITVIGIIISYFIFSTDNLSLLWKILLFAGIIALSVYVYIHKLEVYDVKLHSCFKPA